MDCYNIGEGTSWVRIFHAAPEAPTVDVYIDDTLVVPNLAFTEFSEYMPVPTGERMVDVYAAGTTTEPVIAVMLTVPDRKILTAAATGNMDDLQLITLDDDSENGVTEGSSTARAVHLAPNAPGVDITANDMTVANNLMFRQMTDYVVVPPGTYNVNVSAAGTDDSVLQFGVRLEANTISTVYICGDLPELDPIHVLDGGTFLCR